MTARQCRIDTTHNTFTIRATLFFISTAVLFLFLAPVSFGQAVNDAIVADDNYYEEPEVTILPEDEEEGPPESFYEDLEREAAIKDRWFITYLLQLGIRKALDVEDINNYQVSAHFEYEMSSSEAVDLQIALDLAEDAKVKIQDEVGNLSEGYLEFLKHMLFGYQTLSKSIPFKLFLEEYVSVSESMNLDVEEYSDYVSALLELYLVMERQSEVYDLLKRFDFLSDDLRALLLLEEYEKVAKSILAKSTFENGDYVFGPNISELYLALVKVGHTDELIKILNQRLTTIESDVALRFFSEDRGGFLSFSGSIEQQIKDSKIETLTLLGILHDAREESELSHFFLNKAVEESHIPPFDSWFPELDAAFPQMVLALSYLKNGSTKLARRVLAREFNGEKSFFEEEMTEGGMLENFNGVFEFTEQNWKASSDSFLYASAPNFDTIDQSMASSFLGGNSVFPSVRETAGAFIKSAFRELKFDNSSSSDLIDLRTDQSFRRAQKLSNSQVSVALEQMALRAAENSGVADIVRSIQDVRKEAELLIRAKNSSSFLGQQGFETDDLDVINERLANLDRLTFKLEKQLFRRAPDQQVLSSLEPVDIPTVQELLQADEALVMFSETPAFLSTKSEVFVWAITKSKVRWRKVAADSSTLADLVQSLRCGLDRSNWLGSAKKCLELLEIKTVNAPLEGDFLPFDYDKAHELYQLLFSDIEDIISGKELIISTYGSLSQLPFHVLVTSPVGEDQNYMESSVSPSWLGVENSITIIPSVSSFKALRTLTKDDVQASKFLGMGNPLLQGEPLEEQKAIEATQKSECNWNAPPEDSRHPNVIARRGINPIKSPLGNAEPSAIQQLSPLPETADEICTVAKTFGREKSTIYLGKNLTETKLKSLSREGDLQKHGIIHFATHGTLAGEISGINQPGLIMTPPEIPSSIDDGYLSAPEISSLRLNADWIILSACNTAAGNSNDNEALAGMASAFFYSGSRSLIVSHWYVDSQTSVDLITATMRYYKEQNNRGKAYAFRRAITEIINRGNYQSHPEFWAPFMLVGNGL